MAELNSQSGQDWLGRVRQQYPAVAVWLERPDMKNLIEQAAREEWTNGQLFGAITGTTYWKSTTAEQRAWDATVATDPQTAQRQYWMALQRVQQMRTKLGVDIADATYAQITNDATRGGWDDNSIRTALLGAHANGGYHNLPAGDLGANMTAVNKVADEYGVTASDEMRYKYAVQLLDGSTDEQGLAEYFKTQALSRYSRNANLVNALNQGVTVKQYADPYMQVAAKELNKNPLEMSLSDPQWSRFLEEGTNGQQGMTLDEWRRHLRTNPAYGWDKTDNARQESANLVAQLGRKFGVTA